MLTITLVLLGFCGWVVGGWLLDEIAECRAARTRPRKPVHRRPPVLPRAAAAFAAGWRELAHHHAILTGGTQWT